MNIFLTGYRCTGKTSVGNALAKDLNWPVLDADAELVKECGMTIKEIVSKNGWEAFRKKEKNIMLKLCSLNKHVIATGGGVILDPDNIKNMKKSGRVVWLRAKPDTIKKRIFKDANTQDQRPSLTPKGLENEIEETLAVRNPLYEAAMDFFIDTDDMSVSEICRKIKNKLFI